MEFLPEKHTFKIIQLILASLSENVLENEHFIQKKINIPKLFFSRDIELQRISIKKSKIKTRDNISKEEGL